MKKNILELMRRVTETTEIEEWENVNDAPDMQREVGAMVTSRRYQGSRKDAEKQRRPVHLLVVGLLVAGLLVV